MSMDRALAEPVEIWRVHKITGNEPPGATIVDFGGRKLRLTLEGSGTGEFESTWSRPGPGPSFFLVRDLQGLEAGALALETWLWTDRKVVAVSQFLPYIVYGRHSDAMGPLSLNDLVDRLRVAVSQHSLFSAWVDKRIAA